MRKKIFSADNGYVLAPAPDADIVDHVPAGVYMVNVNDESGIMYLAKEGDSFELPKTLLGKTTRNAKLIADAYNQRGTPTGVLLEGIKGSGKTLLGRAVANELIKKGVPVFKIENAYLPAVMREIAAHCGGHCCFFFDEFEKTYSEDAREHMVGFFSDADLGKVMNIVTTNDADDLPDAVINRPGRFLFNIHFGGIEDDVLESLIKKANLSDELADMMRSYGKTHTLTFDIAETVIGLVKGAEDVGDAIERINLYNVPTPPIQSYGLMGMWLNDELVDHSLVSFDVVENNVVKVKTFDITGVVPNMEHTFNLLDPELSTPMTMNAFTVMSLDGTVKVMVSREWQRRTASHGRGLRSAAITHHYVMQNDALATARAAAEEKGEEFDEKAMGEFLQPSAPEDGTDGKEMVFHGKISSGVAKSIAHNSLFGAQGSPSRALRGWSMNLHGDPRSDASE